MERHDDATKEWGPLRDRALIPSAITYEPKINSRTVHGGRTESGEQHNGGAADGVANTVGGHRIYLYPAMVVVRSS